METKEQELTEFLKKRKDLKVDSCLHVDSDDTCTTTVSLHAAQPENGDSTTEQVFIQYDMLPTKPLAFCSSLILKKNLYASCCCLEYSCFLWYEK